MANWWRHYQKQLCQKRNSSITRMNKFPQLYNNIKVMVRSFIHLFIYLGFYIAFNTVQVISRWVVGRAEETNTYSWSMFCTVNCQPVTSNYQLSHLRSGQEPKSDLRDGRRECYHSAGTVAPGEVIQYDL